MGRPRDKNDDGRQVTFSFCSSPAQVIPQADGSVLIRPGRQVLQEWMTAKALGDEFGRSEATVHRWRQEGLIPDGYYRFAGRRNVDYRADVIPLLRKVFAADHGEEN
jgi:hypothetical protein